MNWRRWLQSLYQRSYGFLFVDRVKSFELIFRPAALAAALLIWNLILVPSRIKLIMPPVSVKWSVSLTVSTLFSRAVERISERRFFSEALINRMWQVLVTSPSV